MKSTFSRTLISASIILLLMLVFVGLSLQLLVQGYLRNRAVDELRADADAISELAEAYARQGKWDSQSFRLTVALMAKASGVDAILCDENGVVQLCADAPLGCSHQGMALSSQYMRKVLSSEYVTDVGVIRGIYSDSRYVVGVPLLDRATSQPMGAVISSVTTADTVSVLHRFSHMYLTAALLVLAVSLGVTIILTRRHSDPLREMAQAASAFGHGDLSARVTVDRHSASEVQELALAFNNMAVSLQKSQERQQEFVANVSHELKTPMTTIGGYVDGILDGTIPPEKRRQYMEQVSQETKRLSRLVRSMLEISRLQEQETVPEEQKQVFDICECAGLVLISFERAIGQKKLDVQVDMPEHPVFTRANQDAITQVIYNLLDNAVKFSQTVLGIRVRESGKKIYLSVYNDGGTIPPEELPLVFDRFHKLDKSRGGEKEGWGLGLYIVKNTICHHGEDISVSSRDGRTEFTFTLPLVN